MPGGKIVVYTGILPVTKTEAGLAVGVGTGVSSLSSETQSLAMAAMGGAGVPEAKQKAAEFGVSF